MLSFEDRIDLMTCCTLAQTTASKHDCCHLVGHLMEVNWCHRPASQRWMGTRDSPISASLRWAILTSWRPVRATSSSATPGYYYRLTTSTESCSPEQLIHQSSSLHDASSHHLSIAGSAILLMKAFPAPAEVVAQCKAPKA